jgi:hypothetical protein
MREVVEELWPELAISRYLLHRMVPLAEVYPRHRPLDL